MPESLVGVRGDTNNINFQVRLAVVLELLYHNFRRMCFVYFLFL